MPATEIQADWAAQRIKNLSLFKAVVNAMLPKRNQKDITSLIEEFQYPKYGPGMMWERCRELVEAQGTKVHHGAPASSTIHHEGGRAVAVTAETRRRADRATRATDVISSMPIARLLKAMDPPVPERARRPPTACSYRDFLTVALVVPEAGRLPRQLDLHPRPRGAARPHPELRLVVAVHGEGGPHLPRPRVLRVRGRRPVGDARRRPRRAGHARAGRRSAWSSPDRSRPATSCGCRRRTRCTTTPTRPTSSVLRDWLADNAPNVLPVGRNGMHKYNNQDHSMYTAMLTVENILGRRPRHLGGQRRGGVPRAEGGRGPGERRHRPRCARALPRGRRRRPRGPQADLTRGRLTPVPAVSGRRTSTRGRALRVRTCKRQVRHAGCRTDRGRSLAGTCLLIRPVVPPPRSRINQLVDVLGGDGRHARLRWHRRDTFELRQNSVSAFRQGPVTQCRDPTTDSPSSRRGR